MTYGVQPAPCYMRPGTILDWIEKSLAHEQKGVRAVYNKAEYREQRAEMLQDWANMIDEWTSK